LPLVDTSRISLQGTSLGGFVVATTAGLDRGYHSVFILLAGGDLADVLTNGKKDAQKVRQAMMAGGMGEVEYRQMLSRIEPLRLAHRINANRTWLFSGRYDDVVPPHNSELLATSAHLPEGHHIKLLANHYSGIIFLPMISQQMSQHMRE
jgi:dipeptidyl aminopeptidase/acylaminoacyl peptidase